MKKNLFLRGSLILVLLMIAVSFVPAQEFKSNTFLEVDNLLYQGLFENEFAIEEWSAYLERQERIELYEKHKKDFVVPCAMNFFGNYGVGSFYQGDTKGGWVLFSGCVAGDVMIVLGYNMIFSSALNVETVTYDDYSDTTGDSYTEKIFAGFLCAAGGVLLKESFRLGGAIRAKCYADKYNNTLKCALSGTSRNGFNLSAFPVIDPQNQEYGMRLCMRF